MWMVENQEKEFERLGLVFNGLWGRPLHAIDAQGLFCETDKYCRLAFPELASQRKRMKAKFSETPKRIDFFLPPKWDLEERVSSPAEPAWSTEVRTERRAARGPRGAAGAESHP
jgi:hypothetical protein